MQLNRFVSIYLQVSLTFEGSLEIIMIISLSTKNAFYLFHFFLNQSRVFLCATCLKRLGL